MVIAVDVLPRPADTLAPSSAASLQRFLGLLFLNMFVVTAWLASIAPFFSMTVSDALGGPLGLYSSMLYPVLLIIAMGFIEFSPTRIPRNPVVTWSLVSLILALAMYGFFRGNATRSIAFDAVAFTTVFGGYVLGRRDRIWYDLRPVLALLLGLSVVGALLFTSPIVLIDRSILTTQPGNHFEGPLVLATLFCVVAAFDRDRRWFYAFLALSLGSFVVYLYFGRRGITTRCALELVVILFVVPAMQKQFTSIVRSMFVAVLVVGALLVYFPFEQLAGRFVGESGVTQTLTSDNERWLEAEELLRQFNGPELLVGRGMGGTYAPADAAPILDEISEGVFARMSAHSNFAHILLKGGVLFLLVCYGPILLLIGRIRSRLPGDYITLAVAMSALIALPFQSLEGTVTWTAPFVGFGFGLLMSRSQNLRRSGNARMRSPGVLHPT